MPSNWIGKTGSICWATPGCLSAWNRQTFWLYGSRRLLCTQTDGDDAQKDHHLQRTRPGQSDALFDTAGRIFRLSTRLFGWNRIWPLPVPSLCPQPERANSESADKWKKIPTLISGVRTSWQPADCSDGLSKYDDRSLLKRGFSNAYCPHWLKKSVIILDNARFHRMGVLREMAENGDIRYCLCTLFTWAQPDWEGVGEYWRYLRTVLSGLRPIWRCATVLFWF